MTVFAAPTALEAELHPSTSPWSRRLSEAKVAYITRHVVGLLPADGSAAPAPPAVPAAGDVILARVEALGEYREIERPDGRRARLFVGDEIIVAYGARYATDAYEGIVPDDLGTCDLLSAGGMAGRVVGSNAIVGQPTRLSPIGVLAGPDGRALSLRSAAVIPPASRPPAEHPPVVAIVGTSMNAGKTTSAASLVRGLSNAGLKVAAAKVTGTGAGNDKWHLIDAGASPVRDFTDAGLASTHLVLPEDLVETYFGLVSALTESGADVIVVEIADGVGHVETARLLAEPAVRATLDGVLFAAGDALGAVAGANILRSWQLRIAGVTGLLTASPLAAREAGRLLDLPVIGTLDLMDPVVATGVVPSVRR